MIDGLLALRSRPDERPVMKQNWHHLTFVHWALDPEVVQSRLPEGLEADLFEGKAYVSLVPFTMTGVTPVRLRPRPFFSDFHETNVRTYVRCKGKNPGVWFFSLEASKRFPVIVARAWYKLPYHFAEMSVSPGASGCSYSTKREWPGPRAPSTSVHCTFAGEPRTAAPGTLEFWLLERYLLYARFRGRFWTGRVFHEPYRFLPARIPELRETLTEAAGFTDLGPPIPQAQYCPGVSVEVFRLRPNE